MSGDATTLVLPTVKQLIPILRTVMESGADTPIPKQPNWYIGMESWDHGNRRGIALIYDNGDDNNWCCFAAERMTALKIGYRQLATLLRQGWIEQYKNPPKLTIVDRTAVIDGV